MINEIQLVLTASGPLDQLKREGCWGAGLGKRDWDGMPGLGFPGTLIFRRMRPVPRGEVGEVGVFIKVFRRAGG
jgi:hypothetical protein